MRKLIAVFVLSLCSLSVYAMTFVEFMNEVPPGSPVSRAPCQLEDPSITYFCQDFIIGDHYYRAVLNAPSLQSEIVRMIDFDEEAGKVTGEISVEEVIERHQLANSI